MPCETPTRSRKGVTAWALYDWANSAFATTVMAGFFPVLFKQYWSAGVPVSTSSLRLGVANSLASLTVALVAPLLGAMADARRVRKRWLLGFTTVGVAATGLMVALGPGSWLAALWLFALGSVGFMGGMVFYDSLLIVVAAPGDRDRVSALGYALGYLGGGLLFAVNVAMTLAPQAFGFTNATEAAKVAFATVAVWWAVFSIPLFVRVREPSSGAVRGAWRVVKQSLSELRGTAREVRRLRVVFGFLVAYWLYIDGVDTVVRTAIDYGLSIGLSSKDLIAALLITQFVGFPAAMAFGRLARVIGPKRGILVGIAVYCAVTVFASFLRTALGFYVLAVVVGLVQGGVQALSRSLYARMVPAGKESEFFGFYNMLGKFAAVLGPVLVGGASALTGSPRLSILTLLALFGGGAALLARVDVHAGEAAAAHAAPGSP